MEQSRLVKVSSFLKSYINKVTIPCYQEFPFIVLSIYMMNNVSRSLEDASFTFSSSSAYYVIIGNLLILFLFSYIGAAIISFVKKKYIYIISKVFMYLIVISLYVITHFLLQNFCLKISPTCIVLLAETTDNEASEFINQYVLSNTIIPTVKMATMFLILIVVLEFLWKNVKSRISYIPITLKRLFTIFISFLLIGGGVYTIYSSRQVYKIESPDQLVHYAIPDNPMSSIYNSIMIVNKMEKCVTDAITLNKSLSKENIVCITNSDLLNIVVVIGESYIKHHCQLYGYPLKTTPFLFEEVQNNNLFVFNDVISSSNQTSNVIKNILCCNNSCDGESWHKHPYIPTIFKSAGYNVYYWSNQHNFSQLETFSFTLNSFLYNSQICDISYTKYNKISYNLDEDIVKSFSDSIDYRSNRHNLIMLHLNGQHHDAKGRFPHNKFKHFNADSIKRDAPYIGIEEKEYIADYDNATLYNDYVLHNIIEEFRNSNSIIIYLSDHGDEVYDYRKQKGRDQGPLTPLKLKYQYEIPFMVWCSDIYKAKYPEKVNAIKNAVDRPFISDNICNMLFNIAGIETPYYRDSLDLISPNYKCKKRILNNKYVYEDIRYSINE